jgi:hypothetical protein
MNLVDALDWALATPAVGHPLCRFIPRYGCSRWLSRDWPVSPSNPQQWQAHDNGVTHFGYSGHILGVEGMVCEEQEGRVNAYIVLYNILQWSGVSLPQF